MMTQATEWELQRHGLLPSPWNSHASDSYAASACWFKLALAHLLPPRLMRVLYMDCDMLALTSMQPLLGLDLQGEPFRQLASTRCCAAPAVGAHHQSPSGLGWFLGGRSAGCLLAAARDVGHPCGHARLGECGWPAGRAYFNAGLLVLDLQVGRCMPPVSACAPALSHWSPNTSTSSTHRLQKLRDAAAAIAGMLAEHLSAPGPRLRFHDQDVLNLLAGRLAGGPESPAAGPGWLELPLRWNAQGIGTYARFRLKSEPGSQSLFASHEALQQFEKHPAVVHFTGPPIVTPSAFLNDWVRARWGRVIQACAWAITCALVCSTALRPCQAPSLCCQVPYTSKPWAYLCQHPFVPAFYATLEQTPWRGWRPEQGQVAEACAAELQHLLDRIAAVKEGFDAAAAKRQLVRLLEGHTGS
jgi:lipopolysaccharide biosynthesis glycosyltransferase